MFGSTLAEIGEQNVPELCAITAAMKYGTGLNFFKHRHKERFYDVGMAEEHAVSFAAGLASQGLLPTVAIYSTFFQRAYDQIIHDVSLMHLNVLFGVDRAGLVLATARPTRVSTTRLSSARSGTPYSPRQLCGAEILAAAPCQGYDRSPRHPLRPRQ